ncbi:MAG TPA: serpin family protein, partial [Candidatus Acetothermia bacterium]|nr:serpin family protein [Candidatus Acetothermia bacterium]
FSPHSISLALAMAYAGARGETAAEMAQALYFTLPQERLHPAFNALDLTISARAAAEEIELYIANGFWGQLGHHFLQEYVELLSRNYGAEFHLVDFQGAPEACRARINDWVSERTQGKIEALLPPGSVTPLTRLVLANAIYFQGAWKTQFDPRNTSLEPFRLLGEGEQTVLVLMMRQGAALGYAEGELEGIPYQVVELPYTGNEFGMVILLPELLGFEEFEAGLNAERLELLLAGISTELVVLSMPKFSFSSTFSLRGALSELGMPLAFSPEADFSGIDGSRDLQIDEAYHKAFIRVDEEGSVAAAATGAVQVLKTPPPIIVRIDHPFIFLIRDRETGTILFLGRVLNPAE